MKRKILSIFVVLAMMFTLIPSISFTASAAETVYSEMFDHNGMYGETEHYKLRGYIFGKDNCWEISDKYSHTIRIEPKSVGNSIKSVRLIFDTTADYNALRCSNGEKGTNYGSTTVEFININSESVEIASSTLQYVKEVIVRFTLHSHDDKGEARVNSDKKTHSFKCTICGEYGESYQHVYTDGKCVCGTEEDAIYSETIKFDSKYDAESASFTLHGDEFDHHGWITTFVYANFITIRTKRDDIIIRGIDAIVSYFGDRYGGVSFSDGEKVEQGGVSDGTTVHIKNIFDSQIKFSGNSYTNFKDIKVYYSIVEDDHTHTFTDVYVNNLDGTHTIRCNGCGKRGDTEKHSITTKPSSKLVTGATCTKAATYYVRCDKCEMIDTTKTVSVGTTLPHPYPETWEKHDGIQHKHFCTVCGIAEYQTHIWNNGENKDNVKTYTCEVCGQSKDVKLPKSVSYTYYTANGNTATKHADGKCDDFEIVFENTTTFENGKWYVVSDDITVRNQIKVNGEANLILCDGATLNAEKGISASGNNILNIYAEGEGTGKLIAQSNQAGIEAGTIHIHGGVIEANGGFYGAGIGGYNNTPKEIMIYDGTITAVGGYGAAGIGGGGVTSHSGEIVIYGGNITATGGDNGAGIGGGTFGDDITINGGTIVAKGGVDAAGIGAGEHGASGFVTINGGDITAIGGGTAAGIGSGARSKVTHDEIDTSLEYDKITINNVTKLVAQGSRALGVTAEQAQLEGGVEISDKLAVITGDDEESLTIVSKYNDKKHTIIALTCPHKWKTVITIISNEVFKVYTCDYCGETKNEFIEKLGEHTFDQEVAEEKYFKSAATCTHADEYYMSCKCGEASKDKTFTVGELKEHTWKDATCTAPKTCSVCGVTEGEANGHKLEGATCTKGKYCTVCNETFSDPLGHAMADATCTKPKTCTRCGVTEGEALGHKWTQDAGKKREYCTVCNETKCYEETIYFNEKLSAESEHFTLTSTNCDSDGWYTLNFPKRTITIQSKDNEIMIDGISAVIGYFGANYPNAEFSSGIKAETGGVGNGSTVHVNNVESKSLSIKSKESYVQYKDITIRYYYHDHEFTESARDNNDGTHSFKCKLCDMYGEAVKHTYENGICTVCGVNDPNQAEATDGKAYAQKDGDTAVMRFIWKTKLAENVVIDTIGAYVIPMDLLNSEEVTPTVVYSNPTTTDGQQIKDGNTFAVDIINIPESNYDRPFVAVPFINGNFFMDNSIKITVNEADINK